MRGRISTTLLILLTILYSAATIGSLVSPAYSSTAASFSFASAGDFGSPTGASLTRLAASGADFMLGNGDMSYDSSMPGDAWCSQFKAQFNNIAILPGNHDTGEVTDATGTRSYEKYVAGCPFTLASSLGCGLVAGNCYGKEYYFDYPSVNPLARFIVISPRIFNVTGVCRTSCSSSFSTPCTDQYGCWQYDLYDAHYNWTANAIDNARASGIRWIIVSSHKTCMSAGEETCSIGTPLFNLMISKKVDLILEGHDHTYQRSKQLGFSTSCPRFTTSNSFVVYNSGCVVDDGSRGFYSPGAGTVLVIEGTFGAGFGKVNDPTVNGGANAAEAPYFVSMMGSNTAGAGHGFVKYTVSQDRIDVSTNFGGTFSDGWSIAGSPLPLTTSFTHSPSIIHTGSPANLTATATGGIQPYTFNWNFGDGTTATGALVSHTYSSPGSYNVTLRASDSSGMTASSSQIVSVMTITTFTFAPTDDATIQQSSPTANDGSSTQIIVDNDPVRNFLMKFNVQVTGSIVGATLRLYQVDSSDRGGDFHTASGSWSEGTVNWNNAPLADPTVFFSLGPVSINTWYSVDLTSIVTGNGVVSLRVTSPSPDGSYFASKEAASGIRPQLLIDVSTSANSPPVLTVPGAQTVNEQTSISFIVSATDDPAQTIILTAPSLPSGASFASVSGSGPVTSTFNWTPSEAQGPGSYVATFKATDNLGAFVQKNVSITVNEVNQRSSVIVPGPQTVNVGSTLQFTVTATDPDLPPNTITLSASGLVSGMGFNPATGVFSFTPTADQSGFSYTVSFTATDNGSPSLSDSKQVNISVTSNAPVLNLPGSQSVDETTLLTFTVSASDNPGRTVTITCNNCASLGATFSSSPGTGSASGTVTWTPTEVQGPGTYVLEFTATNDQGFSSTGSVTVIVNEVNQPPVLAHIPDQSVNEATLLNFAASATDPDAPANILSFSLDPGAPSGASITGTGVFSWTPSEAQGPGVYSVTIRVTDNGAPAMSDAKSFTVTVFEVNSPPSLNVPGSQVALVNSTLTFTVAATDSDLPSNTITITASNLASGMSFPGTTGNPVTGTFSFTPTSSQVGMSFVVNFTAADDGSPGLSTSNTVTIRVLAPAPYALVVTYDGRVYRYYQNGTLSLIGRPFSSPLRQVAWKPDGSYALIVGDKAVVLKYDGTQLSTLPNGITTSTNFNTVAWRPDGSYALIGGQGGMLLKYDGASFARIPNSNINNIRSISWKPDGASAIIVGDKGISLLYQTSGQVTVVPTGIGQNLFAVAWNPNGSYALAGAQNGIVLKYNGTGWIALSNVGLTPSGKAVRFISFSPTGNLGLLVGDSGLVWTYDGTSLASMVSGVSQNLYSVSWSAGIAYIVGQNGVMLSYSNGVLRRLTISATSNLGGIAWKPT